MERSGTNQTHPVYQPIHQIYQIIHPLSSFSALFFRYLHEYLIFCCVLFVCTFLVFFLIVVVSVDIIFIIIVVAIIKFKIGYIIQLTSNIFCRNTNVIMVIAIISSFSKKSFVVADALANIPPPSVVSFVAAIVVVDFFIFLVVFILLSLLMMLLSLYF